MPIAAPESGRDLRIALRRSVARWALCALGLAACEPADSSSRVSQGVDTGTGARMDAALRPDSASDAAPGVDAVAPSPDTVALGPDAAPDAPPDAAPDATPDAAPDAGPRCPDLPVVAADASRVILVGHPFTAQPEVKGTEIRGLTLRPDATIADDGIRLDVGAKPVRIAFAPHGLYAFVLGEDGALVSVFVAAAEGMAVIDRVDLPAAGYGDLHVSADGGTVWVTGSNVDESSGISTVEVDCDGNLSVAADAFFPLRLAESTAFLPGDAGALVLGGQAVFDPVDPNDARLLRRRGPDPRDGFEEVGAFDLYHDFVGAGRIAVSPDGRTGALPNNSAFSAETGQMMLVSIDGDTVTEVDRVREVFDASEALFSLDGRTLVLSQVEPGRLGVYRIEDGRISETTELRGIGLADHLARVERGPLADTLLIPSVDPEGGPNITMVRITGPGQVEDLGETPLGRGSLNIATPIAVQP